MALGGDAIVGLNVLRGEFDALRTLLAAPLVDQVQRVVADALEAVGAPEAAGVVRGWGDPEPLGLTVYVGGEPYPHPDANV